MKKFSQAAGLVGLMSVLMGSAALAAEQPAQTLNVTITSFYRVGGPQDPSAELCGAVSVAGANAASLPNGLIPVTVTVDPDTQKPGSYTVLADRKGNFCVFVSTFSGRADAEAWLPGTTLGATDSAKLGLANRR